MRLKSNNLHVRCSLLQAAKRGARALNLTSLGLTADQERVYRHLLRSPGRAPTDLDGLDVPAVLAELHELEVVDATHTPSRPRWRWTA
ncbi:hypothetical protein SUDANB95_01858 [Actinosynnema sp. ALI-1.44]